ncbi:hypothetical protein CJA_3297 [Cellvibrio japonicus Ueda107]|uniref:Uncharacterized protein n=1 Tax=Cellvibrio japonicus (strain Ueda107) TaxID=498211 RepID=B3PEJ5_CELJU|nr:hypothetical protein CJA_3297 [Cellvibrio japonicus Ueda107]
MVLAFFSPAFFLSAAIVTIPVTNVGNVPGYKHYTRVMTKPRVQGSRFHPGSLQ